MNRLKRWFNDKIEIHNLIGLDEFGDKKIYEDPQIVSGKFERRQKLIITNMNREVVSEGRIFIPFNVKIKEEDKVIVEECGERFEYEVVMYYLEKNHKGKPMFKEVIIK